MAKKLSGPKIAAAILIIILACVFGFGYLKQSSALSDPSKIDATKTGDATKIDTTLLAVQPSDIIIGDANALVTIVEYMSLSCTHCAHFEETVLPDLQKQYLDTGKARLVMRHFPLNAPALKASELVECAGQNGLERANFIKVLFNMQEKWAFDEHYEENLKQIAAVGGIDSATFGSCIKDKDLETRLLANRQDAQTKLGVDSTPYFFLNGAKYEGDRTPEGFGKAIKDALAAKK